MTSLGTPYQICPFAVLLSFLCITQRSYPRNLAFSVLAWVIKVFSTDNSRLSSLSKNPLMCSLISSASPLLPEKLSGHLSRLLWHDFGTYVYILQ